MITDTKIFQLLSKYYAFREKAREDRFFLAHLLGYKKIVKLEGTHHLQALEIIKNNRFYVIEFPRDTYKTTFFTIVDGIADILNDPNTCQLICHFAGANARAMLDELATHFLTNDDIRFLFPDICPSNVKRPETGDWCGDSIKVKRTAIFKESTMHALGSDQTTASYHFDKIRFDDLVVEASTTTQDQIVKADNFFKKSFSLLKDMTTAKLGIVGTEWVPDDTMRKIEDGKILAPDGKRFKVFKVPDITNINGERQANFPEILPLNVLDGLLQSQGPIIYSAFYKLDAVEIEGALWRKDMIQYYTELPNELTFRIIGALDPSLGSKDIKAGCDSAVVIIAIDNKNEIWVCEYDLSKGLSKVYDAIFNLYVKWRDATRVLTKKQTGVKVVEKIGRFSHFTIETTLFQKLVAEKLREQMNDRNIFIPIREDNPHTDKTKRIMILDPLIQNKAFHIKYGMEELASQIVRFGRPNSLVDILDAIAQAYKSANLTLKNINSKKRKVQQEFDEMWEEAYII